MLPQDRPSSEAGRVTKGAAYSYLGWAYLTRAYEESDKEAKEEGTLERMQNKIDAISSGNSVNHAGGTIVNLQGNYLKKDTEDAATALISFLKGLLYGNYKPGESGGALKEDGSAEFDSATIRKGLNIGEFSSINRIGEAVLNSISLRNLFQIGEFLIRRIGRPNLGRRRGRVGLFVVEGRIGDWKVFRRQVGREDWRGRCCGVAERVGTWTGNCTGHTVAGILDRGIGHGAVPENGRERGFLYRGGPHACAQGG